jgi:aerobic C4-dicarboxylate transport protein
MKPLGDGFVKLIRMMIAPIIFGTVVVGIAKMGDMKEVGRIGLRALIYFEVVSTIALVIGMVFVNVLKPGAAIHATAAQLDPKAVAAYTTSAAHLTTTDFLMNIIPDDDCERVRDGRHSAGAVLLGAVRPRGASHGQSGQAAREPDRSVHARPLRHGGPDHVRLAIGAFGAMAYTIGQFGIATLLSLGQLMLAMVAACLFFIFAVSAGSRGGRESACSSTWPTSRGNPDRPGDVLVRDRAAAHDGEARTRRLRESPSSGW